MSKHYILETGVASKHKTNWWEILTRKEILLVDKAKESAFASAIGKRK